jgi:hypothetical protein
LIKLDGLVAIQSTFIFISLKSLSELPVEMCALVGLLHSAEWPSSHRPTGKGKEIPLQAWAGPEGSRRLRLPDFKTIGT